MRTDPRNGSPATSAHLGPGSGGDKSQTAESGWKVALQKHGGSMLFLALFCIPGWYLSLVVDPGFPARIRFYIFLFLFIGGPPFLWAWLLLKDRFALIGTILVPAGFGARIVILALLYFSFEDPGLRNRAMVVFLVGLGAFLVFEVASVLRVGIYGRGRT